ncbi:DUF58 domain-containing protein [Nannocystis pusilla]|uniref:DUF58 domain-containing protein n=1 Tax=Nannocystis pusilla TaxID=889268 RepID=A0ABS7TVG4_9BACT|nr:DUF58 domain-containing protein [Nannocystis pusilla]MBZ5712191.1 DUF58 domain-containing protein [Nannocystis pusilla]
MSSGPDPDTALAAALPAELRELLRGRVLRVGQAVWGGRPGRHLAARAGAGDVFRGHRPYVPGDDLRRLDWRAAARDDRYVLRQHDAEDVLSAVFLMDGSGGMSYGTGIERKATYAGALVAGLASLAARQGDRLGLASGGGGGVDLQQLRPQGGSRRLLALAEALGKAPAGICPWPRLVAAVGPQLPRRSLVVLVSDFLDPCADEHASRDMSEGAALPAAEAGLLDELAALAGRGHAVVLLQVLHRDELEFPWSGRELLRLEDVRGVRPEVEGLGASLRAAYLQRLRAYLGAFADGCLGRGLVCHRVVTDTPVTAAFLGLLRALQGEAAAEGGVEVRP